MILVLPTELPPLSNTVKLPVPAKSGILTRISVSDHDTKSEETALAELLVPPVFALGKKQYLL